MLILFLFLTAKAEKEHLFVRFVKDRCAESIQFDSSSGLSKQGVTHRKRRLLVLFLMPILGIGAKTPVKYYRGSFLNL